MPDQDLTSRVYVSQGLRLHYVDWGNPEAPPLILLHGGLDHCRNWDWVAKKLRGDFHIVAPDLRGHGDSQWSPDGYYSITSRKPRPCDASRSRCASSNTRASHHGTWR
jgi:pimeloyl-ACP methyl ester carboxylesterase